MKTIVPTALLISCLQLYAVNHLTFTPTADMPLTTMDGVQVVDLRAIQPGSLISFDIRLEDIDFDFAGADFLIYKPDFLIGTSPNDLDWQKGWGAVFVAGPDLEGKVMRLPANGLGTAVAPNPFRLRLGLVFNNPQFRWQVSPGQRHPGGLLGRISFTYDGGPTCTSRLESIQILLVHDPATNANYDVFADGRGDRVALVDETPVDIYGLVGLPVYFGNPDKYLRGDADLNGIRNSLDALPAALCAMNGPNDPGCNWTGSADVFAQIFDFNCNGEVNVLDALGLARIGLGSRKTDIIARGVINGNRVLAANAREASLLFFSLQGQSLGREPFRLEQDRGWHMISEPGADGVDVLLIHPGGDAPLPAIISNWATDTTVPLVEAWIQNSGRPAEPFQPIFKTR